MSNILSMRAECRHSGTRVECRHSGMRAWIASVGEHEVRGRCQQCNAWQRRSLSPSLSPSLNCNSHACLPCTWPRPMRSWGEDRTLCFGWVGGGLIREVTETKIHGQIHIHGRAQTHTRTHTHTHTHARPQQ